MTEVLNPTQQRKKIAGVCPRSPLNKNSTDWVMCLRDIKRFQIFSAIASCTVQMTFNLNI